MVDQCEVQPQQQPVLMETYQQNPSSQRQVNIKFYKQNPSL